MKRESKCQKQRDREGRHVSKFLETETLYWCKIKTGISCRPGTVLMHLKVLKILLKPSSWNKELLLYSLRVYTVVFRPIMLIKEKWESFETPQIMQQNGQPSGPISFSSTLLKEMPHRRSDGRQINILFPTSRVIPLSHVRL